MFPTDTAEVMRAEFEKLINDTTVQVLIRAAPRPPSPPIADAVPELMDPVAQVTRDMWGNVPVIPVMSTGATDSRFFRALGVPAFGVSGLFPDPTVDARAHGRDERMRIQSYYEGQEFLYRLTKALTTSEQYVPSAARSSATRNCVCTASLGHDCGAAASERSPASRVLSAGSALLSSSQASSAPEHARAVAERGAKQLGPKRRVEQVAADRLARVGRRTGDRCCRRRRRSRSRPGRGC